MSEVPVKPAATVVLINEDNGEVLLMLRHAKVGFMPEYWVFPGGRVDPEDGDGELGFRNAVYRETIEEAGLVLSQPPHLLPEGVERCITSELAALERAPLHFFARWVTPPTEGTRRYDTYFYAAWVPGYHVQADGGELTSARWLSPREALDLHEAGTLWMAPPTYMVLLTLAELQGDADWDASARQRVQAFLEAASLVEKGALCPLMTRNDSETTVAFCAEDGLPLPESLRAIQGLRLAQKAWWPIYA